MKPSNYINNLSDNTKGILLIIMGSILGLYAFGMLAVSLHFLVLVFAAALIAAGVYLLRDKVVAVLKRGNHKR